MRDLEVECVVATLLVGDAAVAEAALAAVGEEPLRAHGVLFLAVMASARWGTDVAGALRRLAEGAEAPASWSDYEARTAREELGEEADAALARLDGLRIDEALSQRVRHALSLDAGR